MTAPPAEALSDLKVALGRDLDGEIAFDDHTRNLFSRDASMYSIVPAGVVFPRHAGDIAAVVAHARTFRVPVLARGAGTSLAGQTVGPGLVVDCSRYMSAIVDIDRETAVARLQPGVVQDDLNRAAAPLGLMFGPDTSTSNRATIGGMIGNNSAGSGSIRHGMTIDHVRSLAVVLSDATTATLAPLDEEALARRAASPTLDGAIHRRLPELVRANAAAIEEDYPPFWRRAGGYRLDRLARPGPFDPASFVVGSEGTLVVVTEAEVGLVPRPGATVFAVGHFGTVEEAIDATADALAADPAGVEMIDRTILDLSRRSLEYGDLARLLDGDPEALLYVSFTGDTEAEAVAAMDRLIATWRRNRHGYHTLRAIDPGQQQALLKVRKAGLGLLMASSVGPRRPLAFVEDTAVPPERLGEYTRGFRAILDSHGLEAGFYGHCSVGCLHIRPFIDLTRPGQIEVMHRVATEVKDLARHYGGVNSSEHGDGLARSEFNRGLFGDELYEAMREVKRLFDPDGVLNPGKIVDSPSMTENLRDPALPPAIPVDTAWSFPDGMRGAADRCMNIGVCRKSADGVMCPSYMATRREEDSTRGRANALVMALSQPDPAAALGDDRLHEILDLCLMCKACKTECPLGVDLAALKSETLHQRHATRGIPLRSRVVGRARLLNRLGSATAPLSNLPLRLAPVRWAMDRVLGITPHRPLPRFARANLARWWRDRGGPRPGTQGTVTFLADSLTAYTEPEVGRAGVELLERAGWEVRLETTGCCGRPSISKGLLDDARRQARRLGESLAGTDPSSPIVGCEPSCLFALRDEHLALLPGDPVAAAVAGRVRLLEELLVEAIDDGRLLLSDTAWPAGSRILFHGHCHQKAEVGTADTMALLRRIPGAVVEELDAGCCGMAGSFGLESEHYDTSMTIGNDRLFPAIRAAGDDVVIAATGVSCRQQVDHGTGRHAWHPIELIEAALAD